MKSGEGVYLDDKWETLGETESDKWNKVNRVSFAPTPKSYVISDWDNETKSGEYFPAMTPKSALAIATAIAEHQGLKLVPKSAVDPLDELETFIQAEQDKYAMPFYKGMLDKIKSLRQPRKPDTGEAG